MKLELNYWKENEDGSVNMLVEVDEEGKELLFRTAIKTLMLKAIEYSADFEVTNDSGTSVGNSERGRADSKDGSGEQPSKQTQYDLFPETLKVSG